MPAVILPSDAVAQLQDLVKDASNRELSETARLLAASMLVNVVKELLGPRRVGAGERP